MHPIAQQIRGPTFQIPEQRNCWSLMTMTARGRSLFDTPLSHGPFPVCQCSRPQRHTAHLHFIPFSSDLSGAMKSSGTGSQGFCVRWKHAEFTPWFAKTLFDKRVTLSSDTRHPSSKPRIRQRTSSDNQPVKHGHPNLQVHPHISWESNPRLISPPLHSR